MIKNYLIIAIRNLLKDKISAIINLVSLAIGMACCMLIISYIRDEMSYNRFNTNYNNIYRLDLVSNASGEPSQGAGSPVIYAPTMEKAIPHMRAIARLYLRSGSLSNESKKIKFQEYRVQFTDKSIFDIFTIHFSKGNKNALNNINSIVLTEDMAKKYFGGTDVVGKTLLYENTLPLQVTGVVEALPSTSDLSFDFLVSFESFYAVEKPEMTDFVRNDWLFNPAITFCLLDNDQNALSVEGQMNRLIKSRGNERSRQITSVKLTPLKNIHLYSANIQGNPSSSSISYIYIFGAIALLILLIAGVNFINLATARASTRSREVGIRKVLGARRSQLTIQFLGEAIVLSFLAFFGALIIVRAALPYINQLTDKQFTFSVFFERGNLLLFISLFIASGLLAGLYPALFISRFRTVESLKGRSGESARRNYLRKSLLVGQFSISTILIVSAIIIYKQLHYLRSKPLGFRKEQVIDVPIFGRGASILTYGVDGPMRKRMNSFSEELTGFSKITAVTAASELPGQGFVPGLVIPEGARATDNIFMPWVSVDYNFISSLRIPIMAGRDFSKSTGTDHLQAFIINESAAKQCGWTPAQAIGKSFIRGDATKTSKKGQIIGVVKDFNFNSLDQAVEPMVMDVGVPRFNQFAIVVQPDNIPQTLDFIKRTWNSFFPERVFEYSFLDSDIDEQYRDNENLARIIQYFAAIAILLSCLGLFSLASFLSVQRTKEIGIRKVLGASVAGILTLLSKDFLKLVAISSLISIPVAWYAMNTWLNNYAYRIGISWWIFAAAAAFVLLITALTVGLQSLKAAISNPAKSLRTE